MRITLYSFASLRMKTESDSPAESRLCATIH